MICTTPKSDMIQSELWLADLIEKKLRKYLRRTYEELWKVTLKFLNVGKSSLMSLMVRRLPLH